MIASERNQAIFIAGSPGAGKSTLSAFLARQLTIHEIPVRLFHEHDFAHIDAVAQFRKEWYFGDPNTISSWIEATPAFFGPCLASQEVWILDALYPGFFALLGLYSPAEVAAFAGELAAILQPLRPLIVYLAGDPRVFLERAITRRGTGWRDTYVRSPSSGSRMELSKACATSTTGRRICIGGCSNAVQSEATLALQCRARQRHVDVNRMPVQAPVGGQYRYPTEAVDLDGYTSAGGKIGARERLDEVSWRNMV